MALSGATVWEVRPSGSDTNGGGFVSTSTGTDYSQQNTKNTVGNNISTTDAVTNGTTTLTSATATFTTGVKGNIIYLAGGSSGVAAQWREVTTFTNSTGVVLDASVATSSGVTMNIGGALASPGQCAASFVSGNVAWVLQGTYTISTGTANVSGGPVSMTTLGRMEGYAATRNDRGTKPVLQVASTGVTNITVAKWAGAQGTFVNMAVDGQTKSLITGFICNNNSQAYLCKASNCTNFSFNTNANSAFWFCESSGHTTTGAMNGNLFYCEVHGGTHRGFQGLMAVGCIAYNNTTSSADGFWMSPVYCINCVAYNNGGNGFFDNQGGAGSAGQIINCIAEGHTGAGKYGFSSNGVGPNLELHNCAGFGNTTGNVNTAQINGTYNTVITGSASFFVNAAGNNFALNNNAGAGAAMQRGGIPGAMPTAGTGYIDIGALMSNHAIGFFLQ